MRMVEDIIIKPIITEASMDMLEAKKPPNKRAVR